MTIDEELARGAAQLGAALGADQIDLLLRYVQLLRKWNAVYSLTAITEEREMLRRHLLDSLAMVPYIRGRCVVDVGTGPGLPGIPLAIYQPQWQVTLLDSNRKKTRFVRQAVLELGLANATVVTARAEDYQPDTPFDTAVTRAVAPIAELLRGCGHLLAPGGGRFVFMKGVYPADELLALPAGFELTGVYPVTVPGLGAERHAVVVER